MVFRDVAMDLETNGLLPEVTKIHMVILTDLESGVTRGYTDTPEVLSAEQRKDCAGTVDVGLRIASKARLLVTFNGWNYDLLVLEKLKPWWSYEGLHLDLRTHGNTIIPRDKLYLIDRRLVAAGKLPRRLMQSESLGAWATRAGGELKAEYSGPWEVLTREMWDYGLQDGPATASVYYSMMRPKYRVSWSAMWMEQGVARLIGRAQRNGWRFNEGKAADLDAKLQKELGDARRTMERSFGAWYRLEKPKTTHVLVQGPKGGFKMFIPNDLPTRFLTDSRFTMWDVQARKRSTTARVRTPEQGILSYEEGAPYSPVELHHFNSSSRQDVYTALHKKYGWEPKERTDTGGPKVSGETLASLEWPEAKAAHRYYELEKLAGYVAGWRKVVRNGRIYGTIHHNRANTRRMTHASPNLAQVPAGGDYGSACRELFEADEGWVSVGADAAGLELRTFANRLALFDGGAFAEELLNGDPHIAFASAATELTREAITSHVRREGKTLTYAYL